MRLVVSHRYEYKGPHWHLLEACQTQRYLRSALYEQPKLYFAYDWLGSGHRGQHIPRKLVERNIHHDCRYVDEEGSWMLVKE
jgi:hypothetical protein